MPYHIQKMPNNKAFVVAQDGKHLSHKPLPLMRAKKQLIAVNIAHAVKSGHLKMMGKK
jgi:hypothetical protein